jgi:hypothetical protein
MREGVCVRSRVRALLLLLLLLLPPPLLLLLLLLLTHRTFTGLLWFVPHRPI